jgi:hypothetical protein
MRVVLICIKSLFKEPNALQLIKVTLIYSKLECLSLTVFLTNEVCLKVEHLSKLHLGKLVTEPIVIQA